MIAGLSGDDRKVQAITVDRIREASISDPVIEQMVSLVSQGCPEDKAKWPKELLAYYPHRQCLSTQDGVLIFKGSVMIPNALRKETLDTLHCGH